MDKKTFWESIDQSGGPDACWPWTRARKKTGYGLLKFYGKASRAHKVAYALENGPISKGQCVCHQCDNPACCNPRHLFLATHAENMADAVAKDRFPHRAGSENQTSKLTEYSVIQIRALATTGMTQKKIGEQFGVTQCVVSTIVLRTAWKHI